MALSQMPGAIQINKSVRGLATYKPAPHTHTHRARARKVPGQVAVTEHGTQASRLCLKSVSGSFSGLARCKKKWVLSQ
jgi:hypothetical protein